MRWVTITHPEAGTTQVPESSVPFHASNGWTVIPDPPPAPRHAPPPAGEAEPKPQTPTPTTRRASTKKEND
jgi:hypothetical protein